MKTHRMIATTAPTTAQVETVYRLLVGAMAATVAKGASFDAVFAEIKEAIDGRPVRESAARMVAHAITLVGCGATVVPV